MIVAACAATTRGRPSDGHRSDGAEAHGPCTVEERARTEVVTADDVALGIQPVALAASGREVLLAGWPSYAHRRHGPSPRRVAADDLLGAVVAPNGVATRVTTPIAARLIRAVRVLPRPGGGWDVVFAERPPFPEGEIPAADPVAKLWSGVYRDGRWRSLVEIPVPSGLTLTAVSASELVRVGDTLVWALLSTPGDPDRTATVFRQHDGVWSARTVPVGFAAYAAMAHHPRLGTALAVVRAPERLGEGGVMSLYLHRLAASSAPAERLDAGAMPVHHPSIVATRDGFLVSWYVEDEERGVRTVRAAVVTPGSATGPILEIETDYAHRRPVTLLSAGDDPWWVVGHDRNASTVPTRILRGIGANIREVGRFSNDFRPSAAVIAADGGDGLIASGVVLGDTTVVSHLVRLTSRCTPVGDTAPPG